MHHDSNWAKHSYVALCGTSSQPLLGMLGRYPNIETVHLCLDNDQAGQLATRRLAKVVREKGLQLDPLDGERLFDYSGVDFSFATFQNLTFPECFHFREKAFFLLLFVLFIYFLPKS